MKVFNECKAFELIKIINFSHQIWILHIQKGERNLRTEKKDETKIFNSKMKLKNIYRYTKFYKKKLFIS